PPKRRPSASGVLGVVGAGAVFFLNQSNIVSPTLMLTAMEFCYATDGELVVLASIFFAKSSR
ncbi:MAG: hypothetical protein ACRCYJ_13635, partial [Plesiomonas shigelloides]